MPMITTVLEARIEPAQETALLDSFKKATSEAAPPGMLASTLQRMVQDRMIWRIESLWQSREALDAMRASGTPRGIQIFRSAGAEPVLTILEVVAELPPVRRDRSLM